MGGGGRGCGTQIWGRSGVGDKGYPGVAPCDQVSSWTTQGGLYREERGDSPEGRSVRRHCSVTPQHTPACIPGKGHLHALHRHAPADRLHADPRLNHFRAIRQARPTLGPETPDVRVAVASVLAALFQDDGLGGGVHAHVHGKLCGRVTAERLGTPRPLCHHM